MLIKSARAGLVALRVLSLAAAAAVSPVLFADSFTPYSVNDSGMIVGSYAATGCVGAQCYQAFTYNPSTTAYTFVTPPGSTSSQFIGINDSGQIVGSYGNSSGNYGFLLSGGTYSGINPPGVRQVTPSSPYNGGGTSAIGISDNGEIVGEWTNSSGVIDGFTYSGGAFTNTSISDSAFATTLYGVNDSGLISGFTQSSNGSHTSFLYNGSTFTTISVPGASQTIVQGINDSGEAVGFYTLDGSTFGFTYLNDTYATVIYPGSSYTALFGISNDGELVGEYACASGGCPFTTDPAFYAIPTQNGYAFTTLATPEPGSLVLLGIGLVVLLGLARWMDRRRSVEALLPSSSI
jgi:hypothetical protein